MDTLDEKDAARFQLDFLAVVLAQAGHEVEFGDVHLLPVDHPHDVLFHQGVVHGLEVVEVETPVREARRVQPVHEIVVGGHRQGLEAAGLQLDGQTLAEGGLSGGGRPGDEDDLDGIGAAVAAVDLLGDLDDLLFLQGFRNLDELGGMAVEDGAVDVAHSVQAHDDVPPEVLLEHLIRLGLVHERGEDIRVLQVGFPQEDPVVIGLDAPDGQVAGGGDEFSVVVVGRVVQGIIVRICLAAGLQELDLVVVAGFPEFLDGLFGLDIIPVERQVLRHEFLHPGFQELQVLAGEVRAVGLAQVAEVAAGNRVLHIQLAVREHVRGRLVHQEAQRAEVHPPPAGFPDVQELDVLVLVHLELEALGDVVDLGRYDRVGPVKFEVGQHLGEGSALRILPGGLRVLAIDLQHGNYSLIVVVRFTGREKAMPLASSARPQSL